MKKKTKTFIVLILVAVLALIAVRVMNMFGKKARDTYLETHYIFDKNFRTGKTDAGASENSYFSNGMINAHALDLFRLMDEIFPLKSRDDLAGHYTAVRQYFDSQFKETEARKLFEIYQKYLPCQIELLNSSQYEAKNPDIRNLLALLYKVQKFRTDKMGKETAAALFGPEVKEKEYFLRRELIIVDQALYGKEKENRLSRLKADMWEGEAVPLGEDDNHYNRYQRKLQLYSKDLAELKEKERQLKVEEFRKEFFTKEQIKKLQGVDAQIAGENEKLKRYRMAEKKIGDSKELSPAQRDQKIKTLQDDNFGPEADAFRRAEAIQKSLEKKQ